VIRERHAARGFSLIELIVVIVIASVLAVFMVSFLGTPIQAYAAQSRRAALADSADHVLRSVATDVRTALPSSLRSGGVGSVHALELLATAGVARYYGVGEDGDNPVKELSIDTADPSFYTLGYFASSNGSYLAVDQQTLPGAYTVGGGVMVSFAQPPSSITLVGATAEDWVQCVPGCDFSNPSPTNSVFLVSGPVSYLCDTGAGTLNRYSGYTVSTVEPISDAALMAAGATRALIAQNVSSCTINIVPPQASATPAFNQLLILEVTLANSGETLVVFDEAAPEYLP
jgi:MSHA biogenesis protein MshO